MNRRHAPTARRATSVRVRCPSGHRSDVSVDELSIVHTRGMVAGFHFACRACGTTTEVVSAPEVLAVLHAFGVGALRTAERAEVPHPASLRREVVSLRVLLDHPDQLAALLAPAHPDPRVQAPSSTPQS